jgi:hypothetical protein
MNAFMTLGLVLGTLAAGACMDPPAPEPSTGSGDTASRMVDESDLLPLDTAATTGPETVAHGNCGRLLYCSDQNNFPMYQCYANTGCTAKQNHADYVADCKAVCGASACGTWDIMNSPPCPMGI